VPLPLYQAKAEMFRCLGHPARIRILELLSEEDLAVHQLLSSITIEQSNLSQQLSVLRAAGLVAQRREGAEVIYSLALPEVRELLRAGRHLLETKHAAAAARLVDEVTRPAATR
jgi:DNA-binding transcriptional ArsR family regulator